MKIEQLLKLNNPLAISSTALNTLIDKPTFVFYLPEPNKQGIDFVNQFRKKGIFSAALIFKYYIFNNRRINSNDYIKEFRKKNPNVPIIYDIKSLTKKNFNENKIIFIDLTLFSELFLIQKSIFRFRAFYQYLKIINDIIDSLKIDINQIYIFYESSASMHPFFDYLLLYLRKNSYKIKEELLKVNGFLGFDNSTKLKVYPFAVREKQKEEYFLKFKLPIINAFKKEVLLIDEKEEKKNYEEIIQELEPKIDKIINSSLSSKNNKTLDNILKSQTQKKELNDTFDDIYNTLVKIDPNKSIEENIKYLKEKFKDKKEYQSFIKKVDKFIKYYNEINKKFNGMIELNEELVKKVNNSFYNPVEIVGIKNINVYNRQATEFDEVLDQSILDLFKKLEEDKELGIQIKDIKSEIVDTNKDRLKKYYITIKQTKFGKKQPYTIELDIPYPINGKYLKFGANTYIMINQLFIKPIIKINNQSVRFYSHFGTITVKLKNHAFNELQSFSKLIENFTKLVPLKTKQIYEYFDENKIQLVERNLEKYNISNLDTIFSQKVFEFEVK